MSENHSMKTSAISALAFFVLLSSSAVLAHKFEKNGITVGHPWARATPEGMTAGAGYLKITNTGKDADKLLSGTFENAKATEFHEMKDEGGVMKMRALSGVEIKPGETLIFAPGGNHLMFMGLSKPVVPGTVYKGTLTFEKAGSIDVEFKAEPVGALESADR